MKPYGYLRLHPHQQSNVTIYYRSPIQQNTKGMMSSPSTLEYVRRHRATCNVLSCDVPVGRDILQLRRMRRGVYYGV
jgi:hypothetical protein